MTATPEVEMRTVRAEDPKSRTPSRGEERLRLEIMALANEINASMEDLKALGANRIRDKDIPNATDELSAIVDTTEVATGQILDATERVEAICQDVADTEQANAIRQAVTDIYESCNFQDLTGQRVRKVVDTLRNIDHRIAAICASFGLDATVTAKDGSIVRPPDIAAASAEELLNGPALPGEGMSQDDIDRMLAEA